MFILWKEIVILEVIKLIREKHAKVDREESCHGRKSRKKKMKRKMKIVVTQSALKKLNKAQ